MRMALYCGLEWSELHSTYWGNDDAFLNRHGKS